MQGELAESYDYIIIGAGSSGCVLAERLSADPRNRVLLVEAGGPDISPWITMPKGIAKLVTSAPHVWVYQVDQPRISGMPSQEVWIRGRGLGGSSSINGMIWSRGEAADYDDWAAQGCTGWNAQTMLEAFRAIEDHDLGASDTRGSGGPVHVTADAYRYPLAERMIAAGEAMGLTRTDDLNSRGGERVGYYSHNIHKGRRQSGPVAFLRKAAKRTNLHILTDTLARHVRISNGRAVGIGLRSAGRGDFVVGCDGEVILSAGTLESPRILQRSGVGDGAMLQAAGVATQVHSPDVGRRMREHLSFTMPFRLKRNSGIARHYYGAGLLASAARYYLTRGGPLATGPFEVGAFLSTRGVGERTDLQLYLSGYMFALADNNHPVPLGAVDRRPGMTVSGTLLHMTSEGSVEIRGPEPDDPVSIQPNWLSTPEDQAAAIASIRLMRAYVDQPALAEDVGEECIPGAQVQEDAALLESFRALSTSGLHGVGTCRMGGDDRAVLDPYLRVRGVDRLRVIDCSIMPGTISGNTNAPAMAVGWRAAQLLAEDRWA
ncbi:glucose-methanol-choline oxidoreductase [Sphingobium sp. SCG-1]|uniref:GMC family oxidoreductase n=1 Tax=Sphingobium sp. SCG-1 TaxID=2072936 RepID=UPI000CD6975C|nr:GMC family oxidoreductase N-terminal domain-containing protein [Sphingobium sp. SCG-1]AUW58942.1 glucose-methanol-choline oxidoreductase [Sphingobium sp. SCG-1]